MAVNVYDIMLFNIIFVFLRIYAFQSGHVVMFMPAVSSRDLQLNFSAFTVIEIHFFYFTVPAMYKALGSKTWFTHMHKHTRTHECTHARTHDVHACYVYACMFSLNIPVVSLPSMSRSQRVASVRHQPEQGRVSNCVPNLRRWLRNARDDAV